MNGYLKTLSSYKKAILVSLYLLFSLAILVHINSLITKSPITSDAEQNLRMSYNLYNHQVLSANIPDRGDVLHPTNYREPLPPLINAFFMYLHPQIQKETSYKSLSEGIHAKKIKQVNLGWIMLLLMGVGLLSYHTTRKWIVPFILFGFVAFYFIRFGGHFDNLNTELPAATLIIWSAYFLVLNINKNNLLSNFLIGIFLGLLILIKGVFYYLFPVVLLFLIAFNFFSKRFKNEKRLYINIGIFVFGVILIVGPWLVRNKIFFGEYQITQRGGIVLHYRALKNQMTSEEVLGAVHFYGSPIYKTVSSRLFNIKDSDFDVGGRYQRVNRYHSEDMSAISQGKPDQAVSFYAITRAERSRLTDYYSSLGAEDPFRIADKNLGREAKKMILGNPAKHIFMTAVFFWRGMWCFPNSTIPGLGESIQSFINSCINLLSFISMFLVLYISWKKKMWTLTALVIIPLTMILFQSFISHNIPRYSEPVIPVSLLSLTIVLDQLISWIKGNLVFK